MIWVLIGRPQNISETRDVLSRVTTLAPIKETSINTIDIIEATNKERIAIGLPPLATDEKLNASAKLKVQDMIDRQYFEHQSPTGEGVSDLGRKTGYSYVIMGENLALGSFSTSEEIVEAWMDSPGHKANMLNPKYQDIGVSAIQAMYEGRMVWFSVQHFGTSRSVCPGIDEDLKREIDGINRDIREEERVIGVLKRELEAPGASLRPTYKSEIESFNVLVDNYNAKLSLSRQKVAIYNGEVKEFNKCIATFQ